MAPRLKVFCTTNGLTQYIVATSSKAKALAAWGTKQDLFAAGLASETQDATLAEEALARPGEVVRRSVASGEALLAAAPPPPKRKGEAKAPPKAKAKKGPSKEALERVRKVEEKLSDLEDRRAAALEDLEQRRHALAEEEAQLDAKFERKRRELRERLDDARAALDH